MKVAIIRGKGHPTRDWFYTWMEKYPEAELWTLNDDFDKKRSVRHFDMHSPRNHREADGGGEKLIEVVSHDNYPMKEIEAKYRERMCQFINNSISYMVLYAGYLGFDVICFAGCDFNMEEIRQRQVENVERVLVGLGRAQEIKIELPPASAGGLLFARRERYGKNENKNDNRWMREH